MCKKLLVVVFMSLCLTSIEGCDYCEFMYGENDLGARFRLVNESKNNVYIEYCLSPSCCTFGFDVVPSKVDDVAYDKRWIIARTVSEKKGDSFWIIDKDFAIDVENCHQESCKGVVNEHVRGPLKIDEFSTEKNQLQIKLDFY